MDGVSDGKECGNVVWYGVMGKAVVVMTMVLAVRSGNFVVWLCILVMLW